MARNGTDIMRASLMPLMNDQQVADRILGHIDAGSTDHGEEVWREPVANYTCEGRLRREIEDVMWRWPTVFCPATAIPQPGDYIAREAAGTPIVAIRQRDGSVRAFLNACRHRGMQVARDSGRCKVLVCDYHGWAYQLDGSLSHVPHEAGFPGLDRACHGLVPVEAREQDGLVYVVQRPSAGCWEALSDIPAILARDQHILTRNEYIVEANWKLFAEGFLEGLHIRSTHPESFYPYGYDNLTLLETYGRNSRITFSVPAYRETQGAAAGAAPGRRSPHLRAQPVPQRDDRHPVPFHLGGRAGPTGRRPDPRHQLDAHQSRQARITTGRGGCTARRKFRQQHGREGRPARGGGDSAFRGQPRQ